jgi:hypothetical protein
MNGLKGFLEDTVEKVEEGVKSQAQAVVQSTKGQVTGGQQATSSDHGTNEAATTDPSQQIAKQATKDFVKELYAPSDHQGAGNTGEGSAKEPSEFVKEQLEKGTVPDEAMKLEALRKKLHDEVYYVPLTQRKPHEVEQKEEEQKKEQEKMEALENEEEKKKKDRPIAVQMADSRTERFPGASG